MQTQMDKTNLNELYTIDENLWYFENVKLIREGKLDLVDWEHISEALEDMGRRDFKEILSRMRILIMHLLKWIFQPEYRSRSWELTMKEQRKELNYDFDTSKNLLNFAEKNYHKAYKDAIDLASTETGLPLSTFPKEPPFTFEQAIDEDWMPKDK